MMFEVEDLRLVGDSIRKAGFRLTPAEPIPEPHQTTWFIHPRDAQGMLIELGQPVRKQSADVGTIQTGPAVAGGGDGAPVSRGAGGTSVGVPRRLAAERKRGGDGGVSPDAGVPGRPHRR